MIARLARALRAIPGDIRLFLLGMAAMVPLRVVQTAHVQTMYVDGGYYAEVASHVRDGEGIVTMASLYHFGYERFPYPTSVYPLWVTVLGLTSRWVDLFVAAHWLPLAFGLLAITAAFGFGRRLWPEPVFPEVLPELHAGHVLALCIGLHGEFVMFTSLPYTEGIGWALLFLYLWRVATKGADTSAAWAIESGLWLGVLYLARFQFLVVPLAAAGALAVRVLLGPDRLRAGLHAALALAVAGAIIGGWWLHLRTFVYEPDVSSLLRFDQNRANDLLHPVDVIVENHGLVDFVVDRLAGVELAWDPTTDASYGGPFWAMHWALPAALPLLGLAAVRRARERGLRGLLEDLQRPGVVPWLTIGLVALGGLLSVHVIHKQFNGSWYFTKRQGLMSLLAFALPLAWLLRERRPLPTVLGALILGATTMAGAGHLWSEATDVASDTRVPERHQKLIDWLQPQAEHGQLVVALDASALQRILWRTRGIGYHWIDDQTRLDDLRTMTGRLGARYVVVRSTSLDDDWEMFADREAFDAAFTPVSGGPAGYRIWRAQP